jgi:hypothetical protein
MYHMVDHMITTTTISNDLEAKLVLWAPFHQAYPLVNFALYWKEGFHLLDDFQAFLIECSATFGNHDNMCSTTMKICSLY